MGALTRLLFGMNAPSVPEDSRALPDPLSSAPGGRRGARFYFFASLNSQATTLLRYVILARILGPEQLGIATTLVLTGAFFDLVSDTGSDRFLVQDRYGGAPEVQSLVQFVYAARGVLIAFALVTLAIPIAAFYRTPRLAAGLAILGLSPLILGFQHLDVRRSQRDHDFRGQAKCMIAADLSSLVVTAAAAWITRDFTAILYGLIFRAGVIVLISHLVATRPYRIAWHFDHGPRLSRFAAPLMVNGLLLFLVTQGDRIIVARLLGLKNLGLYSATALLIYYPSVLLANYLHAMYVPMIAGRRDAPAERDCVGDMLGGQTLLLGAAMACGFAMVTPTLAPFLFGLKFAQAPLVVALVGILQTSRFFLGWPTTVALAMGRSMTVLFSNAAHVFAFAGALIGIGIMGDLSGMLTGLILGEFVAAAVALLLLNRNAGRQMLSGFERLLGLVLVSAAIVGWNLALTRHSLPGATGMVVLSGSLLIWLYRSEHRVIQEAVSVARGLAAPILRQTRLSMREG